MASALIRLSTDQFEALLDLSRSATRGSAACTYLASKGLAITGSGRYGTWARITEAGQQYLARKRAGGSRAASEQVPAPAKKPASNQIPTVSAPVAASKAGQLLRGAVPRARRMTATNARARAAIPPPAAAQNVGAPTSANRKRKHGA